MYHFVDFSAYNITLNSTFEDIIKQHDFRNKTVKLLAQKFTKWYNWSDNYLAKTISTKLEYTLFISACDENSTRNF